MTWHVWKVTYLRRNVTVVCGASYHLLGSQISQDSKIRFQLQVESYISNWRFSKSWHLARYVSHHNAMAYDKDPPIGNWLVLIHFWIDLIDPVYLSTWRILFFCISEKLWYKTCFPSPGSLGRDLTDLPSRRTSTRVYVGTQWIILYVELVLGST